MFIFLQLLTLIKTVNLIYFTILNSETKQNAECE